VKTDKHFKKSLKHLEKWYVKFYGKICPPVQSTYNTQGDVSISIKKPALSSKMYGKKDEDTNA